MIIAIWRNYSGKILKIFQLYLFGEFDIVIANLPNKITSLSNK